MSIERCGNGEAFPTPVPIYYFNLQPPEYIYKFILKYLKHHNKLEKYICIIFILKKCNIS